MEKKCKDLRLKHDVNTTFLQMPKDVASIVDANYSKKSNKGARRQPSATVTREEAESSSQPRRARGIFTPPLAKRARPTAEATGDLASLMASVGGLEKKYRNKFSICKHCILHLY